MPETLTKNANVGFTDPKGSITGFVGENGAGKTTTIKAVMNLIHFGEGEISVLGTDSRNLPTFTALGNDVTIMGSKK